MSGRFIAVVGPSGVGKDSVMEAMAAAEPRIQLARRVITRPSDAGGETFNSVSIAEFETMRDAGEFALWWTAHGLHYGLPATIDTALADGRDVLANLSRGVLKQAQARFAKFSVISLHASPDVLAARLVARGREDADEITRRLKRASKPVLPDDIAAILLDNSGPLADTARSALNALYPVSR